jgi:hypothetical protein
VRTVETLGEAERGSVWRCPDCTMAWVDGGWCRLSTYPGVTWTPLTTMPAGPFYDLGAIDQLDYSDYRNAVRTAG